uniref:Uncharacterized protein n=2 Tax=Cyclophora tenuis TaxID=216820 RepID=A0A7S1D645_CYCTE|mmetsp:Transcript_24712/g.42037  ORF Transcript_24712/g.42037 Transcript_24712/m.42037 type:complete len:124 (+) Transcript_24712:37-408(+)
MTNLTSLVLDSNPLDTAIPAELFGLPLVDLNLTSCMMQGTLSDSFSQLNATLKKLDLSNNNFTGTVPLGFNELTVLSSLMLQNNALTGNISQGLCALKGTGFNDLKVLTLPPTVQCSCCVDEI